MHDHALSGASEAALSEETLRALRELGGILEEIDRDMEREGYEIRNGRIYAIKTSQEWNPQTTQ